MAALRNGFRIPFKDTHFFKTSVSKVNSNSVSTNTPREHAYDPDGKTVISIMNTEQGAPLMINSYSYLGFRLNNGCFVVGPIAIFPHSLFSWNIKDDYDIHEKSLSLFFNLFPKIDVLVIGLSDARSEKLIMDTRSNIRNMLGGIKQGDRMNVEVLPTEKAVTTFNFLNSENRFVAAALVPPTYYTPTLDDEYRMDYLVKKKNKRELFLP